MLPGRIRGLRKRTLAPAAVATFILLCILSFISSDTQVGVFGSKLSGNSPRDTNDGVFHFLVPATSSNRNLCRLLFSIIALGYPSPTLINWGTKEDKDPYVVHLAKVEKILGYLDQFDASHDADLMLMIDGYDIWFQLPPSVLFERYYAMVAASNARLRSEGHGPDVYNSILFGPDKVSWPEDPARPASWAVPGSTMSRYAFGPQTDSGQWRNHNRPRWLNSGTIMGPVAEVRELFRATHDRITQRFDGTISDQYYLAEIWGDQEFMRTLRRDGSIETEKRMWVSTGYHGEGFVDQVSFRVPLIKESQRTDFHILLDYESALFQTTAYYKEYLGWFRSSDTPIKELDLSLPKDITSSPAPLKHLELEAKEESEIDAEGSGLEDISQLRWEDLPLGKNVASGHIFALVHFTPPKYLIARWWPRMWYFSRAEAIVKRAIFSPEVSARRNEAWSYYASGKTWTNYRPPIKGEDIPATIAYAEDGTLLTWPALCEAHQGAVFHDDMEEDEAPPKPPPPPPPPEPPVEETKVEEEHPPEEETPPPPPVEDEQPAPETTEHPEDGESSFLKWLEDAWNGLIGSGDD